MPDASWVVRSDGDSCDARLWPPCLRLEGDLVAPLELWFQAEDDCRRWVAELVITQEAPDAH